MGRAGVMDYYVTAGLFALALAVGGAGLSYPSLQLLLGLSALAVAAYFALSERSWRFAGNRRLAVVLLLCALLLPLVQLIPLPAWLWHALPGREVAVEVDAMMGWTRWRPISLDVEGTIRSFLVLLPAAVVFIGCLFLPTEKLERMLWVALGFALLSSGLGLFEMVSGGRVTPYQSGHGGYPIGLFVNRNHQASFMLVAMTIAGVIGALHMERGKARATVIVATLSAIVMFAIIVLGTTSRMGLGLLPVAIAIALFTLFRGRAAWRLALPSILGLAGIAMIIFLSGRADKTLARFSSLDDPRFGFWTDVHWTLGHYALAGSGFGTFVPVYQAAESLEGLGPAFVNHAHNDYLEVFLEGGLPGLVLMVLFFGLVAMAAVRLFRSPSGPRRGLLAIAGAAGIGILCVSSIVDYPLRMPSLSALFALLCALLLPDDREVTAAQVTEQASIDHGPPIGNAPGALAKGTAIVVIGLVAVIMIEAAVSSAHLRGSGNVAAAAAWAPWSTAAHERLATRALRPETLDEAAREARFALKLSPIDAGAIRTIGLVEEMHGNGVLATRLMNTAAGLGWRDPVVQLWVIYRASRSGQARVAVERAQALFQQRNFEPVVLTMLLRAARPQQTRAALIDALAPAPRWRRLFLHMGDELEPVDHAAFLDLLSGLDARGSGVTSRETRPFINHLVDLEDYRGARRAWMLSRDQQLLDNAGFETTSVNPDGQREPTSWKMAGEQSHPSLGSSPAAGSGNALRIIDKKHGAILMWQRLLLAPGNYRLTFRAFAPAGTGASLRWDLNCHHGAKIEGASGPRLERSQWVDVGVDVTVPFQDCPMQRLALRALNDDSSREIWIDDVRLNASAR